MTFEQLVKAQWKDYGARHRDKVNLLIHIIAVPLFWIGTFSGISELLFSGLFDALCGVVLVAGSVIAQGLGHEREAIQPLPYTHLWDFIRRIAAEQFINFPRFVFSGEWWERYSSAR